MTLYRTFSLSVFLPLLLYLEEKFFKVKNVGPPAEGNLHLEVDGPMGLWMGFFPFYQLSDGVLVGMKTFTLFSYLPLLPLFLPWYLHLCDYNGTCNIY
jgi:hypothetical protein